MATKMRNIALPACSSRPTLYHSHTFHHHGRRIPEKLGCTGITLSSTSVQKGRQRHQNLLKAQSVFASTSVSAPEGDWLPHFLSWLQANGGFNQSESWLALYEDETGASPSNRGIVFVKASILNEHVLPSLGYTLWCLI